MHSAIPRAATPCYARKPARFALPYVLSAALTACAGDQAGGGAAPAGLMGELAREVGGTPGLEPRLSIEYAHEAPTGRPTVATPAGSHFLPAGSASAERIYRIAARARRAGGTDAMHVEALVDLLWSAPAGKRLDESISTLRGLAGMARRPAPVLADLAAALLVRAERARAPRDLLAAIEAAEEALEREPQHRAALFNRALALQRYGLAEEAAGEWRGYLAVDSSSEWADRARRGLRDAAATPVPPAAPSADAPVAAFAAFAAADPQGARVLGWCRVLGDWGASVLEGDSEAAEAHLRRAAVIGSTLERRDGGDASLAEGVRAIRTEKHAAARSKLARAHREFAAGCALEARVEFRAAATRFAAAAAAAGSSPALRAWARVMYGGTLYHSGRSPVAETILLDVAATADPARTPALAGRARQLLAMVSLRGDRYDTMLEHARRGRELFVRAGERENEGVMLDALSNARFSVGEADEGYLLAHRALERLRPYRGSYRLHNHLAQNARVASADGFARAAVRVQDEGVRVAERTGNPVYVAEARLARARLLSALGARSRVAADVAVARRAVAMIADPRVRGWMVAQRQLAEAAPSLRSDPARTAVALDSVAKFFHDMHAPRLAFPAVVEGARARLAAGDAAGGTDRLEHALAILEQRRDSIRMEPRRAAVFEAARELVDRVAMLKLAAGRSEEALAYLDRGRASLASVGSRRVPGADRALSGPPGEVALEYALVGDTLLAWTVYGRQIQLSRTVVDTARLVSTIAQVRRQLEDAAPEAEIRPGLARLHEWLVRPLAGRLGGPGTLVVVVADGYVASVPFAALYDTQRGRYLVEDHALRFAPSLQEARRPRRRPGGAEPVFVADPAFEPREHPGFQRLNDAAGEVREIVAGYPRARVLPDTAAHQGAVLAALGQAAMVHYAGHAVFDDERPERAYLLLAPTPGKPASSRLYARDIAQLDLRHLSLVVLAACQSVRTGPGRAAGFSGLAGAFLAAGAGGAVGSLWDVDDRSTRRLMVEFHRAYRDTGNGPGALRAAQLRLLRSTDEALHSPAAWAGFRYAGS